MQEDEALNATLDVQGDLDYVSLTVGTSSTFAGVQQIVPPMSVEQDYLQQIKKLTFFHERLL